LSKKPRDTYFAGSLADLESVAPPRRAVDYAKFNSRSHEVVIRVYDEAGNVIETH
jgi:hypothetical protein